MKLNKKEQIVLLDAFDRLSEFLELTTEEIQLIERLNRLNPKYALKMFGHKTK